VTVRLPEWRVLRDQLLHKIASPDRFVFGT
jgi:hypothetical protein